MAKGIGASSGIGIGKAVILREEKLNVVRTVIADTDREKERFNRAVEESVSQVTVLAEDMESRVGAAEAEILNGHLMLLQDPMLTGEIENQIEQEKVCSEFAVENVCSQYAQVFAAMDDEMMQQRAADIEDIKNRILRILLGVRSVDVSNLPAGTILAAKDLTPSITAGINPEKVAGIVTELGGRTSHSAILSRALEIPAVVAATDVLNELKDGDELILDGDTGEIWIGPDRDLMVKYQQRQAAYLQEREALNHYVDKPSTTLDGRTVEIAANIGRPEEAERALSSGAEGVGLFRTEFLFMDRKEMPTEEEQFEAYKKAVTAMNKRPVIIRTLDIGGDKEIPYLGLQKDENPYLGYRAIRLCLDRRDDIFRPQLRAILRASAYGTIRIMIPMVTAVEEYREARELIEVIKKELDAEGISYDREIPVGIMVETAAASLMADIFAKEADFFSIGTNDLTQYTLSVDRGNDKVSYLYSSFHPAVLRSIRHIIECGHKEGIMVAMCGEAAGDPLMIPLLLAFGLDEFSMSASSVLRARKCITGYSVKELKKVAETAMSFATAAEVEQYMKEFVKVV